MITTPAIATRVNAQTIDQSWFNVLKTVCEALWGQVNALQTEVSMFLFQSNALLDHLTFPATDVFEIPITENITLTTAQVQVLTAGSAGTLEVGFQYKRGANPWQDVMTTKPSRIYSAGAGISTNGVVNSLYSQLIPGDILRLDITQMQTDLRFWSAQLKYTRT